jgi:PAS domain-containing protein
VEDFFPDLGSGGKWLFFTAAPLMDDEKKITGAIETLQDVTERRRAEEARLESEKRYRTLLDFAPYPIVVFTLDGNVAYLNPRFQKFSAGAWTNWKVDPSPTFHPAWSMRRPRRSSSFLKTR